MKRNTPLFAFFGTPRFSVYVLDALERKGILPALVVTAPDKPRGRGMNISPSPVKTWALERGIDIAQPLRLSDPDFLGPFQNTQWDVCVVAAYAKLITPAILHTPSHGCLNVHPSLLPRFRGPSPVLSAILENTRDTGVSIMLMDEQLDHGPIVSQARIELEEEAWPPKGSFLEELLATEGGNFLAETIPAWLAGNIVPEAQDESKATYTKKFTDTDARIDLDNDPYQELLKIRAFDANPRAHFFSKTKQGKELRVIITDAEIKNSALNILRVIPEGKSEMSFEEFSRLL